MHKQRIKSFSWDFYSKLIIMSYCLLQILRWQMLPQFMDIYYHLLTAWGFIQAGGYSGWDFWQYAPYGRIHIYPPVFHIILAFLIKLGISKIILAKFFEVITPVAFLSILWYFLRKNFNERLAFFALLTFSSSFTFYLSLLNHIPASLAFIFGLLAFHQLLQGRSLRALLLLSLCFYTHIGVAWFLAFSLFFYGLLNKQYQKSCFLIFIPLFILSLPILFKQLAGLKFISNLGMNLNERYLCRFKIIDYLLAFWGLFLAFKQDTKYRLFLSLFFASFIFLVYPYRFFSAQGYLPIIFLSALSLDTLYEKLSSRGIFPTFRLLIMRSAATNDLIRNLVVIATVFLLFLSPTVAMERPNEKGSLNYKLQLFDSAFMGMLFAKGQTLWYPKDYLSAATLIKNNSQDSDIIYCSLGLTGVTLASISGRATANALLPEVGPSRKFDPFLVSKIIIFTQDDDQRVVNRVVSSYKLNKIGENRLFIFYINPLCQVKTVISKASVPFWMILLVSLVFICLFCWLQNY